MPKHEKTNERRNRITTGPRRTLDKGKNRRDESRPAQRSARASTQLSAR